MNPEIYVQEVMGLIEGLVNQIPMVEKAVGNQRVVESRQCLISL